MSTALVLDCLDFAWNRREAARQDYELARAEYGWACGRLDCARPGSAERFLAARERVLRARERWRGLQG